MADIGPTSGTVTFLFTDVEGSTRLWAQHGAAMRIATALHEHRLLDLGHAELALDVLRGMRATQWGSSPWATGLARWLGDPSLGDEPLPDLDELVDRTLEAIAALGDDL